MCRVSTFTNRFAILRNCKKCFQLFFPDCLIQSGKKCWETLFALYEFTWFWMAKQIQFFCSVRVSLFVFELCAHDFALMFGILGDSSADSVSSGVVQKLHCRMSHASQSSCSCQAIRMLFSRGPNGMRSARMNRRRRYESSNELAHKPNRNQLSRDNSPRANRDCAGWPLPRSI